MLLRGQSSSECVVFASRPKLRLWIASTDGSVSATYLFKDLLLEQHQNIDLLPDAECDVTDESLDDLQFGPLLLFKVNVFKRFQFLRFQFFLIDVILHCRKLCL